MYIDPIVCIQHWRNRSVLFTASFSQIRILALQALITIDGRYVKCIANTFWFCHFPVFFRSIFVRSFVRSFILNMDLLCDAFLSISIERCVMRINIHKMNRTKAFTFIQNCVQNNTCTYSHTSKFTYMQSNAHFSLNWIFRCNHWDWKCDIE